MIPRTAVLKAAFEALYFSGASRLSAPLTQGIGAIFCMHHVIPHGAGESRFAPNANLESSPEFLDAALTMLRGRGYELISMDEVARRITAGKGSGRPFAAFTLDDGYRDNLVHGLPVFAAHDCPFTLYVTSGLVDGTSEIWWRALEQLIAQGQAFEFEGERIQVPILSDREKWSAWKKLSRRVQNMEEHEQRQWIRSTSAQCGIDLGKMCRDVIMTWEEIREMARHPLATIGAHTLNHFALRRLPETEAGFEIMESGRRLELELGVRPSHFAYPYGNVAHANARDFALCRDAGYVTGVTTRLGTIFPEHADHLHALPRIIVSSRYARTRWLQVLASGLPGFLKNGLRRLNVD